MVAHERHTTVGEDGRVTISGLPLPPGQRVRVTVAVEDDDRSQLAAKLKSLFQEMRKPPAVQKLTEEQIAAEIAEHRRSTGSAG